MKSEGEIFGLLPNVFSFYHHETMAEWANSLVKVITGYLVVMNSIPGSSSTKKALAIPNSSLKIK